MFSIILAFALAIGGDTPAQQLDLAAAKNWMGLVDARRWDDSWTAAGTLFKSQMPQVRWASTIASARDPLGPVSSRDLADVTKTTSLPGVPDGEYEVLQYRTSFQNKAAATETIVLAREASGWKVNGYFLK